MRSEDVCGMKREGNKAAREKAPRFRPRWPSYYLSRDGGAGLLIPILLERTAIRHRRIAWHYTYGILQ
jgi:hypothetical protein